MKGLRHLIAAMAGPMSLFAAREDIPLDVWRMEPRTPVLEKSCSSGLHGRVAELERINADNAVAAETRDWSGTAWRGERIHAQFVVWTDLPKGRLRAEPPMFVAPSGARLPAGSVSVRFVRHVFASQQARNRQVALPERLVGDCLDDIESLNLPTNGYRAVWLTVDVPMSAVPGAYRGALRLKTDVGSLAFGLSLKVLHRTLPPLEKRTFFLDLWQHPWAVARYHGVRPFSDEHLALMKPLLKMLAEAGQRTITVTLTDLPWSHNNYDAYHAMIRHVRNADGSWTRDYSLFDKYVRFAKACGIGPQIHCYSIAPWGHRVYYEDGVTGNRVCETLKAGEGGYERFWGPLLAELEKHVRENGWLGETYVAADETEPEELRAMLACVCRHAPGLKIAMAGNGLSEAVADLGLDAYSQALERAPLRRPNVAHDVTFYPCNFPTRPNTFTTSPLVESHWMGLYAAAKGYDGMLRWAGFNWPRDPLFDSAFGGLPAGDTFLIYPGARASTRWELLRDGIEDFEKISVLRRGGEMTQKLEAALSAIDMPDERNSAAEETRKRVNAVVDELCLDEMPAANCRGKKDRKVTP